MTCTRCSGTGFLNLHQIPIYEIGLAEELPSWAFREFVLDWIAHQPDHDVQVCDCCGDGATWYGDPGQHDRKDFGLQGPYSHNGGLSECY